MEDFFHTIGVNCFLRSKEPNISLFFIFELHLLHIFNWLIKIMFKRSLLLTSMKFFTSSSFFNGSAAVTYYSHLHLLLSLAPLRIDWLPWQLVGHVPLNWSKVLSKLLQFKSHHVCVEVTGKRVNPGFGLGLGIQVNYFFMEMQEL